MYQAHFGLQELPFSLTPDTSFAFSGAAHQEALETLLVAAASGEGFIKITGEVGTGKTLLCRRFLAELGGSAVSAYLPNPGLDPRGLLISLVEELGLPVDSAAEWGALLRQTNSALLECARAQTPVILCVDEAQAIPLETLEAIRLLSNLETSKRKLIQVVLFGQPELDRRLAQDNLRQLRQRISFQYHLRGLAPRELEHYLAHRLRVAGYGDRPPFTPPAVRALHRASGGVPRLVNILAHKCLLLVYGEGGYDVTRRHVAAAAADTPAAKALSSWSLPLHLDGWMAHR